MRSRTGRTLGDERLGGRDPRFYAERNARTPVRLALVPGTRQSRREPGTNVFHLDAVVHIRLVLLRRLAV